MGKARVIIYLYYLYVDIFPAGAMVVFCSVTGDRVAQIASAGMGASAALKGGVELGNALKQHGDDLTAAFQAFDKTMRPFVNKHQCMIPLRSQIMVPSSRFFLSIRRLLWTVMRYLRKRELARNQ